MLRTTAEAANSTRCDGKIYYRSPTSLLHVHSVTFRGVGGEDSGNKTLMKCSNMLREKAERSPFKFAFEIPDVGLALFSQSSFRKQEAENGVSEPSRPIDDH